MRHVAASSRMLRLLLLACVTVGALRSARADQDVVLHSGNGTAVPGPDQFVHVLDFRRQGLVTPAAADFDAARNGPAATIGAAHPAWLKTLPADPAAQWVALDAARTAHSALYAIPFRVDAGTVTGATLTFDFSVDNAVYGLFVNGTLVGDTSQQGDYHAAFSYVNDGVGPLLHPGEVNWLYVNVYDYGGVAGIVFHAGIAIRGGTFGIEPSSGAAGGTVTARVFGTDFGGLPPAVTLEDPAGAAPLIAALGPVLEAPDVARVLFDLTNAPVGTRDVVIVKADGSRSRLPGAFEVRAPAGPCLHVQLVGPGAFRQGDALRFQLVYTNCGPGDLWGVPVVVEDIPRGASVSMPAGLADPGPPPAPDLPWSDVPIAVPAQGAQALPLVIGHLGAGETGIAEIVLGNIDAALPSVTLRAEAYGPQSAYVDLFGIRWKYDPLEFDCVFGAGKFLVDKWFDGLFDTIPDALQKCVIRSEWEWKDYDREADGRVFSVQRKSIATAGHCLEEAGLLADLGKLAKNIASVTNFVEAISPCLRLLERTVMQINQVHSFDPNEKIGPAGAGVAHYVDPARTMTYAIRFENKAAATAAAQVVHVTDALDPQLVDLSTLRFLSVGWGGATRAVAPFGKSTWESVAAVDGHPEWSAKVRAALDANGRLEWTVETLDAVTGLPVTDPLAGFLPPNVHAPEGEGEVSFAVRLRPGIAEGTVVPNGASIVFDRNPELATNVVHNTVEGTPPTSRVARTRAGYGAPDVLVTVEAADAGAGVEQVEVWVLAPDGPLFAGRGVPGIPVRVKGTFGTTLQLVSVAQDRAGNREALDPARAVAFTPVLTASALSAEVRRGIREKLIFARPAGARLGFALRTAELCERRGRAAEARQLIRDRVVPFTRANLGTRIDVAFGQQLIALCDAYVGQR